MAKAEEMNHRVPGRADTGRMSDSPGISSPKRKAQTALCTGSPSVFSAGSSKNSRFQHMEKSVHSCVAPRLSPSKALLEEPANCGQQRDTPGI
ncbi:unnamed protein product [Rangifer tarandus platyrhynchus]|uniref:Uncharacterized protein n=1 Tax=Rangifer tarandus platyrhynchus TaxID=3082113 RepID=A0AC59Z1E0_RANTA